MHKCKWCKRVIADLSKMNGECECGSRAFVFIHEPEEQAQERKRGAENIYSPEAGVFEVDIESLARNPAVLLDENGVYHILLQKKAR